MNEVHHPDIVRPDGDSAVIAQLCLYPPLRGLVPELHAQLSVNETDFFDVHAPAFTVEQDVNAPVAIPHARFTDLPDPLGNGSLIGAAGLVVERQTVKPDGPTSLSDRHSPIAAHPANQFAHATRVSQ